MLSVPNTRQRCLLFTREHKRCGKSPKDFNTVPRLRKQRNVDMKTADLSITRDMIEINYLSCFYHTRDMIEIKYLSYFYHIYITGWGGNGMVSNWSPAGRQNDR